MARLLFLFFLLSCFGCEDHPVAPETGTADTRAEQATDGEEYSGTGSAENNVEEEAAAKPNVAKAKDWKERIQKGKRTQVTWDDLYEFDYEKGVPTPFLKAIEGKPARLPGFVIPLTDGDVEKMKEFLIVPEPMMCIHVPPPPPNLLLYGTANPPISINSLWEPVWLDGEIKVEKKESIYAVAGFTMKVTGVEPYQEQG